MTFHLVSDRHPYIPNPKTSYFSAVLPIIFFFSLLIYGLFIHPVFFDGGRLPVEVLVLMALSFNAAYLLSQGYKWEEIQQKVITKVGESVPILLILLAVGLLIGSWIVCGTIPMLINYGIEIIDADWIYLFAFIICIIFSMLTGTSWGSAGTIGVVMMGIAEINEANLAITAAAIIGGSFFGDKMSPLSDTTNVVALATDTPIYDHIRSMLYTTGPAAIIAACIYAYLSPAISGHITNSSTSVASLAATTTDLKTIFNFNLLLFLPLIVVIWGSIKRKSIFLTLLMSAWMAMVLAFIFQDFTLDQIFGSFNKGFSVSMIPDHIELQSNVVNILNRGGLYNLIDAIIISILIFAFIGTLDVINAIEVAISGLMKKLNTRRQTVVAALSASWLTSITTSNIYATSFIIGQSFKSKFEKMKIPSKVLSRSIEDAGTMMENIAPWTPSGIFMAATLGVSVIDYAPWQFMSIANIIIAYFLAITGIGCFYNKVGTKFENTKI